MVDHSTSRCLAASSKPRHLCQRLALSGADTAPYRTAFPSHNRRYFPSRRRHWSRQPSPCSRRGTLEASRADRMLGRQNVRIPEQMPNRRHSKAPNRHRRTPGPSSGAPINSIPSSSKARRIAPRVFDRLGGTPSNCSNRSMVRRVTPERSAACSVDHLRKILAALSCKPVITISPSFLPIYRTNYRSVGYSCLAAMHHRKTPRAF